MRNRTGAEGRAVVLGLLLGACSPPPGLQGPDLRPKAVEAVRGRFDARDAFFEQAEVRGFQVIRIHDRPGPGAKEALRATCWFDRRGRLVTVVYAE